ncbi:hypothetical protein BGX31_003441, partial [Mortierella sp. GBA43]
MSKLDQAQLSMRAASDAVRENPHQPLFAQVLHSEIQSHQRLEKDAKLLGMISEVKPAPVAVVPTLTPSPPTQPRALNSFDFKSIPQWDPSWAGSKADVRAFLGMMRDARRCLVQDGTRSVTIDSLRDLWLHAIKKMGGDGADLAESFRSANSWDEMEAQVRHWFLGSDAFPMSDVLKCSWDKGVPVERFCTKFRAAARAAGLLSDDSKVSREFTTMFFLVHFPRSWSFSDIVKEYQCAPPLDVLIKKAQALAIDNPDFTGAGRHLRSIPGLKALLMADEDGAVAKPRADHPRVEAPSSDNAESVPRVKRSFIAPETAGVDKRARRDGCFNCGKPGHFSRDCPEGKENRSGPSRPFEQRRDRGFGARFQG